MDNIIQQMKEIQYRIGNKIDNSYQQNKQNIEIVSGEGIEVKNDGQKISISNSSYAGAAGATGAAGAAGATGADGATGASFKLPSGSGVLGINNGTLFVYQTEECS